jgi:hypothetical protein
MVSGRVPKMTAIFFLSGRAMQPVLVDVQKDNTKIRLR